MKALEPTMPAVKDGRPRRPRDMAIRPLAGVLFGFVAFAAISLALTDNRLVAEWIPLGVIILAPVGLILGGVWGRRKAAAVLALAGRPGRWGRGRMLDELASNRRELNVLTQNISDAVLVYDRRGICTYASPSVVDVLAECPEAFLGSRASSRMHPEASDRIRNAERTLLSGQVEKDRFTYRRFLDSQDGKPVYVEADCALARNGQTGEIEGVIVCARDVTERVELEAQLVRARRQAEDAARVKSEFLANMSYEIRAPMNGVLGFAELLLQAGLEGQDQRHAELIVQSGRSLMLLLNDILDLARIEAGQIVVHSEPTDLAALVEQCTNLHRATAEKKGLAIICEPFANRPGVVVDGLRLRQILLNLIGNAVKFTEQGSITVRTDFEPGQFLLSVEDTGVGIDAARLERIFNPFEQGESDRTTRVGGIGLGLPISRQLAELLGGRLEVRSTPGEGTRFTLTLPLVETEHASCSERGRPPDQEIPPSRKSRILLGEDREADASVIRKMLEGLNQQVTLTRNGEKAVEAALEAHARGKPFDLMLMDIHLPGGGACGVARAIRKEGVTASDLPIIAITAGACPEEIAAARLAGMQGHLAGSPVPDELIAILRRWLPVSIVEEDEIDLEREIRAVTGIQTGLEAPLDSAALQHIWRHRRDEAVAAVALALRSGKLTGTDGSRLARLVEKLAGSAGMFGENELSQRAAAFSRALRSEVGEDVRAELARDLLDAAWN